MFTAAMWCASPEKPQIPQEKVLQVGQLRFVNPLHIVEGRSWLSGGDHRKQKLIRGFTHPQSDRKQSGFYNNIFHYEKL
jgi:hypothetical protein